MHSYVPLPLKHEKVLPLPPVYAALGMAVSYYGYPLFIHLPRWQFLLLCLLLFLIAVICFLRVIRFPSGEIFFAGNSGGKIKRRFYFIGIFAVTAAVGFSLGISARRTVTGSPEMGLPNERVIAVSGILREDPRTLHGGSGLGVLELNSCSGAGGIRATARGSITVFFPSESIPRLKEFGRGSEIYADGILKMGSTGRGLLFNASSVHIVKPAPAIEQFRTGLRMTLLEKFQNRRGREIAEPARDPVLAGSSPYSPPVSYQYKQHQRDKNIFRISFCFHG